MRLALRTLLLLLGLATLLNSLVAQAAPLVRAVTAPVLTSAAGTAVAISQPSGTIVGDLLIATVYVRSNASIAAPAGWNTTIDTANGTSLRQAVYWRVATAAGTGSHTWTLGVAGQVRGGGMIAINAGTFDATTPFDAPAVSSTGSSKTPSTPLTVINSDVLVLAAFSADKGNDPLVAVSPASERYGVEFGAGSGLAVLLSSATQTAPGNLVASASIGVNVSWVAQAWAIKPPSTAPILSWRLDEAAWSGVAGEVLDSSSNNLNGTAKAGSATKPTTAAATPALATNGAGQGTCRYGSFTSANSQYAEVADANLLDLGSFTVSVWVYPRSWPASGLMSILSKDENFEFHLKPSGVVNWWWQDSGSAREFDSTNNAAGRVPINAWTHVAIRFRPGSQTLFLNGVANASASNALAPLSNTDPLQIGADQGFAGRYFNGNLDEVRVFAGALSDAQVLTLAGERHPCAGAAPHHLELLHDGTALTCQPEAITLRACADASCATLFTADVTATLTPSGWVGGDSQTVSNGMASLQLRHSTAEVVTLGIGSASPTPTNTSSNQCYIGVSANCSLDFKDTGFIFDVPNLLANKPSGSIDLIAVRKDDSTQRCVPAFAPGLRTVQFSSTYSNPGTGTRAVLVNGVAITPAPLIPPPVPAQTGVSLNFDANARASIDVRYADAGQMNLSASYTGSVAGGDAGLVLTDSDQFVARPAALCVYSDTVNSDCAVGDASCSAFVRAGDNFRLVVKGVAWESDADTDFCSGNGLTPNYQQSGIALSSSLIAPAGGAVASLGTTSVDITAADLGEKILTNQTVSEVGVFTLTATPAASYLGGPAVGDSDGDGVIDKLSTSVNIGRFYPASFLLSDPILTPACNTGFTYAGLAAQVGPPVQPVKTGQSFGFSGALSARNLGGAVTRNYTGSFAKLTGAGMSYADSAVVSAGTVSASSTTLTVPGVGGSGYLDYSANAATFLLNSAIAPYSLAIRTTALDSDGVTGSLTDTVGSATDILAGSPLADFRLGQARIANAHGSELQSLRLPITVGHFNGAGYVQNPLDSCTAFDPAVLDGYQGNLAVGESTLSYLNTAGAVVAPPVTVQAGSSLAGGYLLSAPGVGNDGSVRLTYSTPTWLQFDWDSNGSLESARALATFGIYQGAQPLIFRRELYRSP